MKSLGVVKTYFNKVLSSDYGNIIQRYWRMFSWLFCLRWKTKIDAIGRPDRGVSDANEQVAAATRSWRQLLLPLWLCCSCFRGSEVQPRGPPLRASPSWPWRSQPNETESTTIHLTFGVRKLNTSPAKSASRHRWQTKSYEQGWIFIGSSELTSRQNEKKLK